MTRTAVILALAAGTLLFGPAALAELQIARLEPPSGSVGTKVIVYASDLFTVGSVELLFGGRSIPFSAFGSPNELLFTVPAWASCGENSVQVKVTEFSGARLSNVATFTVPCPSAPPPGLAQFDTNGNGVIDDAEFFVVIDRWIAGQISDGTFFAVIDAWIMQSSVRAGEAQADLLSVRVTRSGVSFTANAALDLRVEILDTQGERLFLGETSAARLTWTGVSAHGVQSANGVYLYVATTLGEDGRVSRLVGHFAWVR